MAINAAGLDVAGANNPRWNGGLIAVRARSKRDGGGWEIEEF